MSPPKLSTTARNALRRGMERADGRVYGPLRTIAALVGRGFVSDPYYSYRPGARCWATITEAGREAVRP